VRSPLPEAPGLPPPPSPRWVLRAEPDPSRVARLSDALSLPPALCAVLAARGITEPEAARGYLRPRLDQLHPPESLAGAGRAAERILRALDEGETILVHGDYDVDGVAATALLTRRLRTLGGTVVPFVPHRTEDGYDLGPAGLEAAVRNGASLIVTCDCGIGAHDLIGRARGAGIDVIVTDHHAPGETLPPAVAVVNPNRSDCGYPEKGLAGAGVAFKLAQLVSRMRGVDDQELWPELDLVALATVADLVPLTGENRVLVRFGLRALARTRSVGLRALIRVSGLQEEAARGGLEAGQVGFVLAPRINAVGRMGDAGDALRLLLTEDPVEADALARQLDHDNQRRQEEDRRTLDEALRTLSRDYDPAHDFGVVVAGEDWHPGVIGIVASRVVERIHRPAVLVAMNGQTARGSGRSIPELHLHQALSRCRAHLTRFGGHRQAAGMDLARASIAGFRDAFNGAVREQLDGRIPPPVLRADLALDLGQATEELLHWLQYLGPFGMGNPRPVFLARSASVTGSARVVGRGHLKLRLGGAGADRRGLDAMGFGLAARVAPGHVGPRADVVFQLRQNEYRGVRSVQARILDLRPPAGS
jgi:single-stranded-DNA-specific exonuclease